MSEGANTTPPQGRERRPPLPPARARRPPRPGGLGRRPLLPAAVGAVLLFLVVGALGLYRYLDSYWLYRGFPPPKDPAFVTQQGTMQTIHVASPAIGGRSEQVVVYLPPGY